MTDNVQPMTPGELRRMADRSLRGYLEQRRNERRVGGWRLSVTLGSAFADRTGGDWAWLAQDRATHTG